MRLFVGYLLLAASAAGASADASEGKEGGQTFTLPPGVPAGYSTAFTGEYKGTKTPTLSDVYEDNVDNANAQEKDAGQTFTLPPGVPAEYNTVSTGYKGTSNKAHDTSNATDVSITLSLPSDSNFTLPPGVPEGYKTVSAGYNVIKDEDDESSLPSETQPATNSTGVSISLSRPSAQVPRQADTSCSDVLTATFFDENDEERDCTWLAEQLQGRNYDRSNAIYCGMMGAQPLAGYRTPLAAVVCPVTCGRPCTYESSTCKDPSALVEPSSVLKKNKKCSWVAKNVQRIEKYCSAEEGVRTRGDAACPKTCGKCGQLSASVMTEAPSSSPSTVPTLSARPSSTPTIAPVTSAPSAKPSVTASSEPSITASAEPSITASNEPSMTASDAPSFMPTTSPSATPTISHSPTDQPTAKPTRTPTRRPTYDLEQRADDRNAQCGSAMIETYDFDKFPTIDTVCDVCVSTSECAAAGDGTVRCCKWTWGQVCLRVEGIWNEAQVEQRCL